MRFLPGTIAAAALLAAAAQGAERRIGVAGGFNFEDKARNGIQPDHFTRLLAIGPDTVDSNC